MSVLLYLFICAHLFLQCLSMFNMLGRGDLLFKSFEHCEGEPEDIALWVTQRKFNRTTNVLDIDLTSPWPIDDNIILELTAAIKKEGGFKPGSFHIKDPVCVVLGKLLGDLFFDALKLAGTEDCPIPEGQLNIKNFYVDNEKNNQPLIFGDYRARGEFFKDGDTKGCFYLYAEVVPKDQ